MLPETGGQRAKSLFHEFSYRLDADGVKMSAEGSIPPDWDLFQDHFPDFPVVPGVLTLELFRLCAQKMLSELAGCGRTCRLKSISGVKFSRYLRPGDAWKCEIELRDGGDREARFRANLRSEAGNIASAGFVVFLLED